MFFYEAKPLLYFSVKGQGLEELVLNKRTLLQEFPSYQPNLIVE